MTEAIIVLIVPARTVEEQSEFVTDCVPARWRHRVTILSDFGDNLPAGMVLDTLAKKVISSIENLPLGNIDQVLIDENVKCDKPRVENWLIENLPAHTKVKLLTGGGLRKALKNYLLSQGIFWKSAAENEIRKYQSKKESLDRWLQQFNELGVPEIGKMLAGSIRVVDICDEALPFFDFRESDEFGQKTLHCYFEDPDKGGSWVGIQQSLNQRRPVGSVFSMTYPVAGESLDYPDVPADTVVVWEDGLWSGYETVKRLKCMQASPPSGLIRLKFAIVSDFGLVVVRHAIREFGLSGSVIVDTEGAEFVKMLRDPLPPELNIATDLSNDDLFLELHNHVEGHLFRDEKWKEGEIEKLKDIGRQLVRHWVANESSSGDSSEEKVEKFSLGGGGFASTILFRNSVPKVCLPLYWLDGPVELNGNAVIWKPLFIDSRRITDARILNLG